MVESWRKVWRDGITPLLSIRNFQVLRKALQEDDPRLLQGATTTPPPLQCVYDWPVEAACPLAYMGAFEHGGVCRLTRDNYDQDGKLRRQDVGGYATVAQVNEFFGQMCFEINKLLGEPDACRWFLNEWDDQPRAVIRPLLLAEVECSLGNKIRIDAGGEIHQTPPIGGGTFPCCGKTPFEVPVTDRMTHDRAWVSCGLGKEVVDVPVA